MTRRPISSTLSLAVCAIALALSWALASPSAGAGHKAHGAMAPTKSASSGGLVVMTPWSRASAGRARNGVAYFTVTNKGGQADRLIGAKTSIAKKTQLHGHSMSRGIMRMREIKGGLKIAPSATLTFAPRGRHVMLMGLAAPLKAGENFSLTLMFERAGPITVSVAVHPIGDVPKVMHPHK